VAEVTFASPSSHDSTLLVFEGSLVTGPILYPFEADDCVAGIGGGLKGVRGTVFMSMLAFSTSPPRKFSIPSRTDVYSSSLRKICFLNSQLPLFSTISAADQGKSCVGPEEGLLVSFSFSKRTLARLFKSCFLM
jgi:hypothetical protein